MMGVPRDHKTPFKKLHECYECGEKIKRGEKTVTLKIYNDPWADLPCVVKVHTENDDGHGSCLDKLTDNSWSDFRYFTCDCCNRLIISQCPDNGWRSYVKELEDGSQICVACYQKQILEDGHDVQTLKRWSVPGDFFNCGELSNYDWVKVQNADYTRIETTAQAKAFCERALAKIAEGYKVLINYESMAIGGLEGYVSLYIKK